MKYITMPHANKDVAALLELLDGAPSDYRLEHWHDDIIAYHLTTEDNIDSIRAQGLKAHSVYQGYNRDAAVYLFVDNDIHRDNIPVLLGDVEEYAIITVTIPREEIINMRYDGLYNMTFPFAYSAVQFLGDIPAEWITDITVMKHN